ncbi:MAG: hypothetical protein MI864_10980, partial [Pseudomonadales bacterium]|nr:hypothetical protein [Pseudomonadales bacterium]
KITLTNRKAESVSVKVVEHLYRGPEYNISSQTKWQQDDASTISTEVSIPANSTSVMTYTVDYSW